MALSKNVCTFLELISDTKEKYCVEYIIRLVNQFWEIKKGSHVY